MLEVIAGRHDCLQARNLGIKDPVRGQVKYFYDGILQIVNRVEIVLRGAVCHDLTYKVNALLKKFIGLWCLLGRHAGGSQKWILGSDAKDLCPILYGMIPTSAFRISTYAILTIYPRGCKIHLPVLTRDPIESSLMSTVLPLAKDPLVHWHICTHSLARDILVFTS